MNGLRVALYYLRIDYGFSRVELLGNAIKSIRAACELDVALDEGRFTHELVGIDRELLDQVRPYAAEDDICHEP